MELLQFLLNNMESLAGINLKNFEPLIAQIQKNGFDIKKFLSGFNLKEVMPVLAEFFLNNKSRTEPVRHNFGVAPISNIANKDIIFCLNKYFSP